ncbi:hypothetical protein RFI_27141, partial [Reticulomyxa filosa]
STEYFLYPLYLYCLFLLGPHNSQNLTINKQTKKCIYIFFFFSFELYGLLLFMNEEFDVDREEYDKATNRRQKLADIGNIFSAANTTTFLQNLLRDLENKREVAQPNNEFEDEMNEEKGGMTQIVLDPSQSIMHRLSEFQNKEMKYLQREISFLVRNNDSYRHLIDARFDILERAFLAKTRSRKRLEVCLFLFC